MARLGNLATRILVAVVAGAAGPRQPGRMARRAVRLVLVIGAIGLASSRYARAQSRPGSELRLEVETEYLWPSKIDREIDTGSVHLVVGREDAWFGWRAGATATHASGHIIQLDDELSRVRHDSAAGGIGPVGLVRIATPELARIRVALEGSGGLLLYTRAFPAGGSLYNFMWRVGPSIEIRVRDAQWLGLGLRWMHVSNGQGLGPDNPSYEGLGATAWLGWTWPRRRASH
jgi:hypothetical protein